MKYLSKIFIFIILLMIIMSGNNIKNYSISKSNYFGERIERASDYLIRKANNEYVSSYNEGNKREMYTFKNNETYEYRYIGSSPNNYAYFNCSALSNTDTCEIWRIIGVFNTVDEYGNNNYRIKLVKLESVDNSNLNSYLDKIHSKYLKMISSIKFDDAYYSIRLMSNSDYDNTMLLDTNSWLDNGAYPVVYLGYNTVISSGNGSLGDAYLLKIINDGSIRNEAEMVNKDLDKDIIEVSDTGSNLPKIILIVSISIGIIGIVVIGILYYKSRKLRKHYNS